MTRSRFALATLFAFPVITPTAPAAPVPAHLRPAELPFYYPTRVGTRWAYQEGTERWSVSIFRVTEKDGTKVLSRMGVGRGCGSPLGKMVVTQGKVTEAGPDARVPSRTLLVLPLRVGATWEAQGWAATVRGVEKVTVPAGTYDAIRVEEVSRSPGRVVTVTSWYARGVGLVKRVRKTADGEESVRVLKSFQPGRE